MKTCRDLINYILENHLEDEPIHQENGVIVGFETIEEAAKRLEVTDSIIKVWINQGKIDGLLVNGNVIVPKDCKKPETEKKIEASVSLHLLLQE